MPYRDIRRLHSSFSRSVISIARSWSAPTASGMPSTVIETTVAVSRMSPIASSPLTDPVDEPAREQRAQQVDDVLLLVDDRLLARLELAGDTLELPSEVAELVASEVLDLGVEVAAGDPGGGLHEPLGRPSQDASEEQPDDGDRREQDGEDHEDPRAGES